MLSYLRKPAERKKGTITALLCSLRYFFFQAEDGIRDLTVTGVQTCALPICSVWYRVLAGAFPTRDSAVGARAGMWKHGLAARGQGDVLRAPYSFSLSGRAPATSVLRARGIPAVPWGTGSRLLAGAFETPEQASLLEARLKRAGVQATLVIRLGGRTTP